LERSQDHHIERPLQELDVLVIVFAACHLTSRRHSST
jgi:hypothetical protein